MPYLPERKRKKEKYKMCWKRETEMRLKRESKGDKMERRVKQRKEARELHGKGEVS